MPTLPVYNLENKKVGTVELDDRIFAGEMKPHLVNDAVRAQIAWRYEFRTANCRTRSEVKGTRKKMYKQKGTGQARHGDAKAPIFVGGGKAHGPKPRIVRHRINKKVMQQALISALTARQREDRIFVVDGMALEAPNTKTVAKALKAFGVEKALVVNGAGTAEEQNFNRSVKNVGGAKLLKPEGVNVFDVLKFPALVISKSAVELLTQRVSPKESA
jgi:large subunit ribosomal protein L4